jgi:hypothetical protein
VCQSVLDKTIKTLNKFGSLETTVCTHRFRVCVGAFGRTNGYCRNTIPNTKKWAIFSISARTIYKRTLPQAGLLRATPTAFIRATRAMPRDLLAPFTAYPQS